MTGLAMCYLIQGDFYILIKFSCMAEVWSIFNVKVFFPFPAAQNTFIIELCLRASMSLFLQGIGNHKELGLRAPGIH